MPRPTKYSAEVHKRIIALLRVGNFRETACAAAGIDARTMRDWLKRGATGEEPFATFSHDCDEADAEAEKTLLALIARAGTGPKADWRALEFILSHKWPDRWGDRKKIELSGAVSLTAVQELARRLADDAAQTAATTPTSEPGAISADELAQRLDSSVKPE